MMTFSLALLRSSAITGFASASLICAAAHGFAADLTPQEAKRIAIDAYIYGYSLMTSGVTEKAFVNVLAPSPQTFQAPLNQFVDYEDVAISGWPKPICST